MATVAIWKIDSRLDHVIDYIKNTEKTKNKNYGNNKFIADEQNDKVCFVSGINCSTETTYKEMMITKSSFNKLDGIKGFHAFQSFKEGEVTPALAHKIGVQLASEMWGNNYEVMVATHTNTNHIHNHFVINSVSFKDGKKYSDNHLSYAILRTKCNEICEEYKLSTLREKQCKSGIDYGKVYQNYIHKSNYHTIAKQDLDRAIGMSYSYIDFLELMSKMGYDVTNRYGKLSICRKPYKKNIRIERAYGEDYSIESIERRIKTEQLVRVPFPEAYNEYKRKRTYEKSKKQKNHGLYGLYKYYCYILKVYPKHYPNRYLPPFVRTEVTKMEIISKETRLLVREKIETYEQLLFYKNNLGKDISDMLKQRQNLWVRYNRTEKEEDKNSIREKINLLTITLNKLKQEKRLCEEIEESNSKLNEHIKEFEKERNKGEIKNEFK